MRELLHQQKLDAAIHLPLLKPPLSRRECWLFLPHSELQKEYCFSFYLFTRTRYFLVLSTFFACGMRNTEEG